MIKSRNSLLTVALATVLALSACSGSDSGDAADQVSEDSIAAESGDEGGSSNDGGAAGSNPEVEEYCDNVDAYVIEMDKLISDPLNVDVAAIQTVGEELAKTAADLAAAVEGDDRDRFNECSTRFSSIGS